MKRIRKIFLVPVIVLTVIAGCKKDNDSLSEINKSKISSKVASQSVIDSVAELRNQFKLVGVTDIPQDMMKINFNSVEEARVFLTNLEASSFEQKKITQVSGMTKTESKVTKSGKVTQGFGQEFQLWLPNMSLILGKKFRLDWPGGFVITGDIRGEGYYTVGSRFGYERLYSDRPRVDQYGFSFMSSWETYDVNFRSMTPRGGDAQIRFSGMLKIVLVIKDLGQVWNRPVRGNVIAKFGPWLRYSDQYYTGQETMSNQDNYVINYFTY